MRLFEVVGSQNLPWFHDFREQSTAFQKVGIPFFKKQEHCKRFYSEAVQMSVTLVFIDNADPRNIKSV